jgi:phosphonate transport system ATP-binding protein
MSTKIPIYELEQVKVNFVNFAALSDITLQIDEGEIVGLVGSSGAGKSTLISLMNGTLFPTEGEVYILGRNLNQLSSAKLRKIQQKIGTIYQQFNLVDNLRVVHNVNAGHLGRWSFFKAALSLLFPLESEKALAALTQVGIPDKLYAPTVQLSGGQQQRVAIARVLIQNPSVILADEPVSNLDPELSREIISLLRDLSIKNGKTLVVSLHSIELAQIYCDRLIGLCQGRIVFDAPSHQVSENMLRELYRL